MKPWRVGILALSTENVPELFFLLAFRHHVITTANNHTSHLVFPSKSFLTLSASTALWFKSFQQLYNIPRAPGLFELTIETFCTCVVCIQHDHVSFKAQLKQCFCYRIQHISLAIQRFNSYSTTVLLATRTDHSSVLFYPQNLYNLYYHHDTWKWSDRTRTVLLKIISHSVRKRCHFIVDYNSRISWWIFIIFIPLETGMNTTITCNLLT